MCGFAGIWNSKGSKESEINKTLELMIKPLSHRGPDDRGFFIDNEKGIGLHIIDYQFKILVKMVINQ